LALQCGNGVTRLEPDWNRLIGALAKVGRVRVAVGNRSAWGARCIAFADAMLSRHRIEVHEPAADLVGHLSAWSSVFATLGPQPSLQICTRDGVLAWEVYVPAEGADSFAELVIRCRARRQDGDEPLEAPLAASEAVPNDEIDVAGLRESWDSAPIGDPVRYVASAFGLPAGHVLRLVGTKRAERGAISGIQTLLAHAVANQRQIRVRIHGTGVRLSAKIQPTNLRADARRLEVRAQCALFHLSTQRELSGWTIAAGPSSRTRISFEVLDTDDELAYSVGLISPSLQSEEEHLS
jgi:putative heme degradation protein